MESYGQGQGRGLVVVVTVTWGRRDWQSFAELEDGNIKGINIIGSGIKVYAIKAIGVCRRRRRRQYRFTRSSRRYRCQW